MRQVFHSREAAPTDTLTAAQSIARNPWYQPQRLYALLNQFYPVPKGENLRPVPFMPYLNWSPSAWVLPLKFDGGGYRAGGKAMFDSEGNLCVGDNFTVGWQGQDSLWQGHATKFAPNGRPLSPITIGFTGGGMEGGTFGAAVDANDNAWLTSYGSKSISVFDKNGKPLSPPKGINFDGKLGLMQGVIVTPSGDVWVLGIEKSQLVHFPKGDLSKGRIVCEGDSAEPCKSFRAPFPLGIDQQDRIWVSNSGVDHVTRFPASDPSKAENFKTGINNSGLAIDSGGNVWVTNRFGTGLLGMAHLIDMGIHLKLKGVASASDYLTKTMSEQKGGRFGGSVTLLRPDGSQFPGSPFTVEETDACFIEKPPRFGASNGRMEHVVCRNRLIERRLNAVRECSAPQSRHFPLRIADYCLAAMLVLGMLGAAAAENQVQGALQGQNNGQPVHIEAMTLEIRDKDKTATFSGGSAASVAL